MASDLQLEQLFRACDKQGTGHIGPSEFRDLCAGFDIDPVDSDAIFTDLDHDGDGQVSLEDFAWGFRDFLSPGSRRGSMQFCSAPTDELERRHSQARVAWSHLVAGVGEVNIHKFLNNSGPKLAELYEELQTADTTQHLVSHFEGALSSLLKDVKKLYEDNKKMEEMFIREKETHLAHLRNLEEELDAQVARVEAQAREEARAKFEAEKRIIEEKMEAETAELQAHLRLFQKLNTILSRGRSEKQDTTSADIGQDTASENRELRTMLADTRTNLALLHSEMAHLRSEYEDKCRQLNSQQETVVAYMHQNDHVHRQLQLLHEANTKLQDTNDSLLTVMDVSGLRSPRPSSPCCCSHASSTGSPAGLSEGRKRKRVSQPASRSPSDVESLVDSAPASLISTKTGLGDDVQFGIRRLMEDLDSGRSTMRDNMDVDSDKSLQEELIQVNLGQMGTLETDNQSRQLQVDELDCSTKTPIFGRRLISPGNTIEVPLSPVTSRELEPTGAPDRTYKIVFAGDAAVGKSCFIFRFCKGVFINNLGSTLGQERFRSMTKTYFRRADGVMLLYDVTSERSFLNVRQWIQSIDEVTEQRVPIILCGNKVDLRPEARAKGVTCIDMVEGELLARDCGAIFLETSSKTGTNILDAVLTLSREMLTREDVEVQTSSLRISQDHKPTNSCCSKN
ncbi:ras and EF-hand domain-containing protein-like isoform X2 [Periplaneta americana]|uniref:ras and EF-hand domain-containing protein-like isoform X2 n=1 Tax=Periplaneta americana TaxID=6978 RepID=UPI0037E8CF05